MDEMLDTRIEELNLSVRAHNCLKRSGVLTIRQLLTLREAGLLALLNFGRKSYDEVMASLAERGFADPMPVPGPSEPEGPDGPHTSGAGVPRRPSPGGLVPTVEAIPDQEADCR